MEHVLAECLLSVKMAWKDKTFSTRPYMGQIQFSKVLPVILCLQIVCSLLQTLTLRVENV